MFKSWLEHVKKTTYNNPGIKLEKIVSIANETYPKINKTKKYLPRKKNKTYYL